MAGIEKLIATKQEDDRTLYCFLAGTLHRIPEYEPLGYDRIQLLLQVRTEPDAQADPVALLLADITLNQENHDDDHARILEISSTQPGQGFASFALDVLFLLANGYECRGIMGEILAGDFEKQGEQLTAYFRKRGFDVLSQENNVVYPYRIQTTSYREHLPKGINLTLDEVLK